MDDILTINKLAPCFRKDDCQLTFASLTAMKGGLTDGNYRESARVGVKRIKIDGTDAVPGGNYKPLTYTQFIKVFKRIQAEADVALQAQMALRGWVEPDRAAAQRVLMDDGTILSIEEAHKTGCLQKSSGGAKSYDPEAQAQSDTAAVSLPPPTSAPRPAQQPYQEAHLGAAAAGCEATEAAVAVLTAVVDAAVWALEGGGYEASGALLEEAHGDLPPRDCGAGVTETVVSALQEAEVAHDGMAARQQQQNGATLPVRVDGQTMSVSADGHVEFSATSSPAAGSDIGEEEWEGGQRRPEQSAMAVSGQGSVESTGRAGRSGRGRGVQFATADAMMHDHGNFGDGAALDCSRDQSQDSRSHGDLCSQNGDAEGAGRGAMDEGSEGVDGSNGVGDDEEETGGRLGGKRQEEQPLALTEARLIKLQRPEYECMICLQMTTSGISLPCLHGPFCEGCLSVW